MRRTGIVAGVGVLLGVFCGAGVRAQKPPLLPEKDVAALADEISGETAKRNLEGIARFHRQRGSMGFHEAAELVAERLRAYGLSDVTILQFPADGKIFYGTQRSRPAWDAEMGILEELEISDLQACPGSSLMTATPSKPSVTKITISDCMTVKPKRLASYEAQPTVLAEDSESTDTRAQLIDAGEGTKESDYTGKDVKGKIVLVGAQPGAVQDLAVGKYGAAGIVSYAQNQTTAWSGENQDAIRWGHLDTFSPNKTFAFMVSLKTANGFRERLAKGEKITLHAGVKAGQHAGNYEVVTATIPGADAKLKEEEIVFSCHLDHQRPGANDNASGCAAILEVARTLQKLIQESSSCTLTDSEPKPAPDESEQAKKYRERLNQDLNCLIGVGMLRRPARTIRFIFPPEIEGTMALLNVKAPSFLTHLELGHGPTQTLQPLTQSETKNKPPVIGPTEDSGPELAKRIKAVIHMDMVGGGPETKAVFHVTRGPMSLPSFVHDVAWAFADWVNEESYKFAATGRAEYPVVAPEGGKEPLRAEYSAFTMGSDHDVYQDSSFGIPAIYLNDWPDRYIHTNFDSAANIDPTKLKRAAFIGAASGYFLANPPHDLPLAAYSQIFVGDTDRDRQALRRMNNLSIDETELASQKRLDYKIVAAHSLALFLNTTDEDLFPMREVEKQRPPVGKATGDGLLKFIRKQRPKGPLAVFGYDYFSEHVKAAGIATPKLLSYEGLWGAGEEYAYEVLNFADGKRNAQEIRDAVSAEYGPVPLEVVVEYLKALERIGILEEVKK